MIEQINCSSNLSFEDEVVNYGPLFSNVSLYSVANILEYIFIMSHTGYLGNLGLVTIVLPFFPLGMLISKYYIAC